jgi:hypothetical protein
MTETQNQRVVSTLKYVKDWLKENGHPFTATVWRIGVGIFIETQYSYAEGRIIIHRLNPYSTEVITIRGLDATEQSRIEQQLLMMTLALVRDQDGKVTK